MNVFFELADAVVDQEGGKYFAIYDITDTVPVGYLRLLRHSDRVWLEDRFGIRYKKYRYAYPSPAVDLKEFMWIKLKSITL